METSESSESSESSEGNDSGRESDLGYMLNLFHLGQIQRRRRETWRRKQETENKNLKRQEIKVRSQEVSKKKGNCIGEYDLETVSLLDFRVYYCDGGQLSEQYCCENLLVNDNSVFCSQSRDNVQVVLAHNGNRGGDINYINEKPKLFSLTHIVLKAPGAGFTSPVNELEVYIADSWQEIQTIVAQNKSGNTNNNNSINSVSYLRLNPPCSCSSSSNLSHNCTCPKPLSTLAPFNTSSGLNTCITYTLHPPRVGSFVLLNFLSSSGLQENIDCQFVGLYGFLGQRSFPRGDLA